MRTVELELKEKLFSLEEQLLKNDIRISTASIADLMDEGCIEIGESGKQCVHRDGEALESVDGVLYIMSDSSKIVDLSEDCRLLVYMAAKVKKNTRTKASCSSIWKNRSGTWKMVFHQRTACPD